MTEPGPSAPQRTNTGSSSTKRKQRRRQPRVAPQIPSTPQTPPRSSTSGFTPQSATRTPEIYTPQDAGSTNIANAASELHGAGGQFSPGQPAPNSVLGELDRLSETAPRTPPRTPQTPRRTNVSRPGAVLGIPGLKDHEGYLSSGNWKGKSPPSLLSECSDRGDDLEGQHIVRVYETDGYVAIHYVETGKDLIQKVKDDLEPELSTDFHKVESYFLPWTTLYKVLSTYNVEQMLKYLNSRRVDGCRFGDQEVKDLAAEVAPPVNKLKHKERSGSNGQFRRTFATLLLSRHEDMIFDFVRCGLNDKELLYVPFDQRERKPRAAAGPFQRLFDGWKTCDIKDFKVKRWQLSPRFLAVKRTTGKQGESHTKLRHTLHSMEEILPFETSERRDDSGGFATVRFFKLHHDQQDLPRYTKRGRDNDIAVKTLKNEPENTYDQYDAYKNEIDVMERLENIKSPHIARLLTTIEVSSEVSRRERSDYHIVMEAADKSLEELFRDTEWRRATLQQGISDIDLAKWGLSQCFGLAHALQEFHRGLELDNYLKKKLLHCDIKPDNVLWYKDWDPVNADNPTGTVHEVLGVLQLSDFGLSSFRSSKSADNHTVRGNFMDYTAPETDILLVQSPTTDMWHLGCLFIDLATWLVEGAEGYKTFLGDRVTNGLRGEFGRFSKFTPDSTNEDITTVEINPAVLKQATHLSRHPNSSKFVRELCHLAVNYILVIRNPKERQSEVEYRPRSSKPQVLRDRLTSKQVTQVLQDLLKKDDAYFRPSAGHGDFDDFEAPRWRRVPLVLKHSLHHLQVISEKAHSGKLNPEEFELKTQT